jgi:hypothetical protein
MTLKFLLKSQVNSPAACGASCFMPAARELPEPGARNFAGGANYLAPGWFNFACGANYPHQVH